jgi:hypothetical protein
MTSTRRQPTIAELTDRLMQARSKSVDTDTPASEVELHEVLTGYRTDPRTAYNDAVLAVKLLGGTVQPALPPEWAAFVQLESPVVALPMAAGVFPQRVRDLTVFLDSTPNALRPTSTQAAQGFTSVRNWAAKNESNWLARGVARTLGDEVAESTGSDVLARNELAADLWLAGKCEEAVAVWLELPTNPVVSFNRGMGLLFTGRPTEAVAYLKLAADQLPDTSGWSHLARLYLSLAILGQK